MSSKLDIVKYEISLVELEEKVMKLANLIEWVVIKDLIWYWNIDFLLYSLYSLSLNTKFFNLFLGFKAPIIEMDSTLIELII